MVFNYAGGVVNITGDATLVGIGDFVNEGLVTKSGGTGTTTLSLGPLTNTGVVHVSVGTLSITPFNNNGRAEVAAGAVLQATGGTSAGTFATAAGARLNLSSIAMPTGTTFEGSGPVYLDGAVTGLVTGTTCVVAPGAGVSGAFTAVGTLTWTGGMLVGQVTVAPGAVLSIAGDEGKTLWSAAEIRNHGTVNWSGAGAIYNVTGGAADVRNYSDGVMNITGDTTLGGVGNFINEGLLKKTGGTGTTYLTFGVLANSGVIEARSGTITVNGLEQSAGDTRLLGGSIGGGTFNFTGGTLSGTGTVDASVVNAAIVSPGNSPGTLTITGRTRRRVPALCTSNWAGWCPTPDTTG